MVIGCGCGGFVELMAMGGLTGLGAALGYLKWRIWHR